MKPEAQSPLTSQRPYWPHSAKLEMSPTSQTGVEPPHALLTHGGGGDWFGLVDPAHSLLPSPSMSAQVGAPTSEQSSSVWQSWFTRTQYAAFGNVLQT